ncbi:MAG TPA: hypothetical protein PLF22_09960 [Pseudomonadales bacterium]|nr:hypothetical protein [Pseudomonadales bacterium]
MGIIFDLQIYRGSKDAKKSIIQIHRPELNRKPKTLDLEHFCMHSRKIVCYRNGIKEWKVISAYMLAEAIKDTLYHITQPAQYRTRITVVEEKIWFFDIYFSRGISSSKAWGERMQKVVHEAIRNKCGISRDLYMKYYPIRNNQTIPPPPVSKSAYKKPYWDDE